MDNNNNTDNNCRKRSEELHSLRSWFKRATTYLYVKQNDDVKNNEAITCDNRASHFEDIKTKHRTKITKRGVFEHWKTYVIRKLWARKSKYEADKHYHKKLQMKVLNALMTNLLLKGHNISVLPDNRTINSFKMYKSYSNAKACYARMLLRRCFKTWFEYTLMKHKEKILHERIKEILKWHNLEKCMGSWKKYVAKIKRKKIARRKINTARKFYQETLLRKYVKTWNDVCVSADCRMKIERANAHCNTKLLEKYFSFWKMYRRVKRQKLDMQERIRQYTKKKLLKHYFDRLIRYTRSRVNYRESCEQAKILCETKLTRKAFFTWREQYRRTLQEDVKVYKIQSILQSKLHRSVFLKWQSYVFYQKCKRRNISSALSFYKKKLITVAFKKFESYATYRKEKRDRLAYLRNGVAAIVQYIQNECIQKWREALYSTMREKCKFGQAIEFNETSLLRKYLYYWKQFSEQHRTKVLRKKKLHALATNLVLKKFIISWRTRLQSVMEIRKKEMLLISISRKRTMRIYFLFWKKCVILKINERADIESAKLFHKKLLLREGLKDVLKNSLRSLDCRYDLELEDLTIRSVKNFEILRMYFHKWRSLARTGAEFKICKPWYRFGMKNNMRSCRTNTYLVLPEYIERKDVYSPTKFPRGSLPPNCI